MGLNSILGFVESFTLNHFCRICKISANESKTSAFENEELIRMRLNYEKEGTEYKFSVTGIKEACTFHKIEGFHVTENLSVDVMHDLLEGICVYVMESIIWNFIFVDKLFTLQTINTMLQSFDYSQLGLTSSLPAITLTNEKK